MEEKDVFRDYHDNNGYKIRCGYYYPVYRQEYGGNVFYKMPVSRRQADGSTLTVYKQVYFRNKEKDCNIKDGTIIKPLKLWEDFYIRKGDKFNPVFFVVIGDWETKLTEDQQKAEAINDYKKTIEMNDIDFNDDDLPF